MKFDSKIASEMVTELAGESEWLRDHYLARLQRWVELARTDGGGDLVLRLECALYLQCDQVRRLLTEIQNQVRNDRANREVAIKKAGRLDVLVKYEAFAQAQTQKVVEIERQIKELNEAAGARTLVEAARNLDRSAAELSRTLARLHRFPWLALVIGICVSMAAVTLIMVIMQLSDRTWYSLSWMAFAVFLVSMVAVAVTWYSGGSKSAP